MTKDDDPVTIEKLEIVRAPGFETGGFGIDEFSPGINLVHGPNGAGKTTTANSIERVLWPNAVQDSEQIVGHLSLNGDRWRVETLNGRADYQRDGQEASAPNFPPANQRDRYRLSLHDLLQQDTRNESFAETIERESAGGFDLSAAHDELDYKDSPISRRKGVYTDAKNAVKEWRDERSDAEGLEEERSRLTQLRSELEAAKQARQEKDVLAQAVTYREAKSSHEEATSTLDEFPDVLNEVDGDELTQVEELDAEIEASTEKKETAEATRNEAQEVLEETELPDDGVSDGVIARLKERRDSFAENESREAEIEESLEGTKAKRESARTDIPLKIDREELIDLDPGSWAEVSEFARTAETVQAERQRRETIDQWAATDADTEADVRTLERGSKALEDWLMASTGTEPQPDGEAAYRIGTISAAIVSFAGIALGLLVNPLLYSVILAGIALYGYGYHQRQEADTTGGKREPHRESFEQTGLAQPASWTEEAVRERLVGIYDEIAEHKVVEERRQQRDTVVAEQSLESQEQALTEKRAELRETIGAAPETTDIELAVIVRRVLDWQEAHDEVVGLESELATVREHLASARETLQDELGEYGYDEIEDSAIATEYIRELEQRQSKYEEAKRELEQAKATIDEATVELDDLQREQEAVFSALNLEPGDRETLRTYCERVEAYEEAESEVKRTEAVVTQERRKLEGLPGYEPELEEMTIPTLKEQRRRAEETARRYDELQEQISEIEAKIREAKSDDAVEAAMKAKNRSLDALENQLEEDYASLIGDVLVDHVQDATIEASRPAVFQRANELLTTITHGRYMLDLAEGERAFRAIDKAKEKGLALDELSSGTRVQVLLAVRLAFVDHQEQGARLPIVLDETLANTDDLRAEIIIESLIELAKDGRQIFYFTAQGDEVARWRTALQETDEVDWKTIDLADIRDLEESIQPPEVGDFERLVPNPPAPDDHDHESYQEALDVPSFDPYEGAGTAHIWYVVEDVDVLYELLELGIERCGQLQNLFERSRDGLLPGDVEAHREIQQNMAALEEFTQAWQIGRGDRVDRSVLENSGAVSSTFIDRVSRLADEYDGDAEQLVDALYAGQVDRFRHNKAEELEEYLRANGYLVSRESLEITEIRIRMIERLVDKGVNRDTAADQATELLTRLT